MKYGKGYEDTWAGFRGSPAQVRENIETFFGLTAEETAGLTLHEVVLNATNQAHAAGNLGKGLGATAISTHREPARSGSASAKTGGDPWSTPAAAKPEPEGPSPVEAMTKEVEATTDVAALKRLWAANQELFKDEALMAAYKAQGRKLTNK